MRAKTASIGIAVIGLGGWAWWDTARRTDPDDELRRIFVLEIQGLVEEQDGSTRPLAPPTEADLERWHGPRPYVGYRTMASFAGSYEEDAHLLRKAGVSVRSTPLVLSKRWIDLRNSDPVLEAWRGDRRLWVGHKDGSVDPGPNTPLY